MAAALPAVVDYASSDDEDAHVPVSQAAADAGPAVADESRPSASRMIRGAGAFVQAAPEPVLSLAARGGTRVDAPMAGPVLPGPIGSLGVGKARPGVTTVASGATMENVEVDDWFFRQQFANMQSLGFAADPTGGAGTVGDAGAAAHMRGFDVRDATLTKAQRRQLAAARDAAELSGAARVGWGRDRATAVERGALTEAQRKHRVALGLPEDELEEGEGGRAFQDATGAAHGESGPASSGAAAAAGASSGGASGPGSLAAARRQRRRKAEGGDPKDGMSAEAATSDFLGKEETDYQGKSWVEPPAAERAAAAIDPADRVAAVPRKCLHRYIGHSKGVQDVAFFPDTGHLLLTASLDNTVRIWQTSGTRKCQRVYCGHTAGVRQATFRSDGRSFATASYDTHVKIWDTETGKCTGSYQTAAKGTPSCVTFRPGEEDVFVVGASDRRATQFDARSGEIVQTYTYHIDNVTTVTYFDEGRRLVTTGDDKKIFVWEHGINVPMRWIQDPEMHSIPCATMHPSQSMWCAQSMNNQILVYSVSPKFIQNRKIKFTGHINAGYACKLSLSANGQFLASGDGQGRLWVWDWKSRKPYAKLHAHDSGPCIGCAWHPSIGQVVATCGWDGTAKLWGPASGK
ncbi:hypothetical protein FNF29_01526 [Cafeteria roenbergensis]|uniref:Pre-mRNA-processing factor 17 n=1 Tax=Cafeteria roenbergensis TaxID=33653 RepID=A0A5A8CSH0_CAFRO|nr:hypothetical protein FNF29_01526 [Cafeteria roenbergensis]|eukprot:KAA0155609.1 hypothetical protein FNF29_01526 [Cafeteria roenbergensis]